VHVFAPKEQVTSADIEAVYGLKVIVGAVDHHKIVVPVEEKPDWRTP
jgi:hypothetical protein